MRPAVAPTGFEGATDYQRFRNAPSDLGEALMDPAYLGGQLGALALGALTGTTGPGLLFGPLLSNLFARDFDPTFGREKSAIRAAPGNLPFGGLINTATGASFTPPTIDDIIAARAQQILAQVPSALGMAAGRNAGGMGNANISANAVSPAARANVATQMARIGGSASSMFANPVINALSAALRARAIPQTQQRRESGGSGSQGGGGRTSGSNPSASGGSN